MMVRRGWLVAFAVLGAWMWHYDEPWVLVGLRREGDSQEHWLDRDATRSQTYVLPEDRWLDFRLPPEATTVRVVGNASVSSDMSQERNEVAGRSGWRYVIAYQFLDSRNEVLDDGEYHFRTRVTEYQDPDGSAPYTDKFYAEQGVVICDTRAMPHLLHRFAGRCNGMRLRLTSHDAALRDVVVRVYYRHQRPDSDATYAWSRLSRAARDRLCRALVYPQDLTTAYERRNLLRWKWSPLSPVGTEGRDYQRRLLYQLTEVKGRVVDEHELPQGVLCQPNLLATIAVPDEPGTMRLEFEEAANDTPPRVPVEIQVRWFGNRVQQRQSFSFRLTDRCEVRNIPLQAGLLEIQSNRTIAVRPTWAPSDPSAAGPQTLPSSSRPLTSYLAAPEVPVEYKIRHIPGESSPFRVAIRRLFATNQREALANTDLASVPVTWQLLDHQRNVFREGQLSIHAPLSVYDRVVTSPHGQRVSEAEDYFFLLPPEASHIRFVAPRRPVVVAGFTRPLHLHRETMVPEDYQLNRERRSLHRSWYLIQPVDYASRLEQALAVSLRIAMRPPEDNAELLSGKYTWDSFEPDGFWTARFLLIPREDGMIIRDQALDAIYYELPANEEVTVRLVAPSLASRPSPHVIYCREDDRLADLQILVNGRTHHAALLHAKRGEFDLPTMLQQTGDFVPLRVVTERPVRTFACHVEVENQSVFLKRLAHRLDGGTLSFSFQKMTDQEELLRVQVYRVRSSERCKLNVRVRGIPRRSDGLWPAWSIPDRVFNLEPVQETEAIVLGTQDERVGVGQTCFVRLDADLPAGPYELHMTGDSHCRGYVVVYRLFPGSGPRRSGNRSVNALRSINMANLAPDPARAVRARKPIWTYSVSRGVSTILVVLLAGAPTTTLAREAQSLQAMVEQASRDVQFVPTARDELLKAERLFRLTLQQHRQPEELRSSWSRLGWEVAQCEVSGQPVFVFVEDPQHRCGRGCFAFRPSSTSLVIQAPHSFFDTHTRAIALRLFEEGDAAVVAWNTVRRATFDLAHSSGHYFNALTRAVAASGNPSLIVQLHGFSQEKRRSAVAASADLIISNGSRYPAVWFGRAAHLFQRYPGYGSVLRYPFDVRELGATTNTQVQSLRAAGSDSFLHLEMSKDLRNRLRRSSNLRAQLLKDLDTAYRIVQGQR